MFALFILHGTHSIDNLPFYLNLSTYSMDSALKNGITHTCSFRNNLRNKSQWISKMNNHTIHFSWLVLSITNPWAQCSPCADDHLVELGQDFGWTVSLKNSSFGKLGKSLVCAFPRWKSGTLPLVPYHDKTCVTRAVSSDMGIWVSDIEVSVKNQMP